MLQPGSSQAPAAIAGAQLLLWPVLPVCWERRSHVPLTPLSSHVQQRSCFRGLGTCMLVFCDLLETFTYQSWKIRGTPSGREQRIGIMILGKKKEMHVRNLPNKDEIFYFKECFCPQLQVTLNKYSSLPQNLHWWKLEWLRSQLRYIHLEWLYDPV